MSKVILRRSNSFFSYIKFNRNIRIAGILSAFLLLIMSAFATFPLVNRSDTAEATQGTPVSSTTTLTMTSGHTSANLNLAPHDSNGTFSSSSSSESASFDVTTDNYTGYTLSISASDDTKKLISSTVSNASLDSITNSTDASSDICPKGWRLPTYEEQEAITSYVSAFSPVTGGRYYGGSLGDIGSGLWWSSTTYDGLDRYSLYYVGSGLLTGNDDRYFGLYVRCVRAS